MTGIKLTMEFERYLKGRYEDSSEGSLRALHTELNAANRYRDDLDRIAQPSKLRESDSRRQMSDHITYLQGEITIWTNKQEEARVPRMPKQNCVGNPRNGEHCYSNDICVHCSGYKSRHQEQKQALHIHEFIGPSACACGVKPLEFGLYEDHTDTPSKTTNKENAVNFRIQTIKVIDGTISQISGRLFEGGEDTILWQSEPFTDDEGYTRSKREPGVRNAQEKAQAAAEAKIAEIGKKLFK